MMIRKMIRYVRNVFLAYKDALSNRQCCELLLPDVSDTLDSKALYKYYWFADIDVFNSLIVNTKGGGVCVQTQIRGIAREV